MDQVLINELENVNKDIYKCDDCEFHKDINKLGIPYRPERVFYTESSDYKVISIGINPGWGQENIKQYNNGLQDIYRKPNYQDYRHELLEYQKEWGEKHGNTKPGSYQIKLTSLFEKLNRRLNIYPHESQFSKIYDYVFWCNLSLCSSQSPTERNFDGTKHINISCNVYNEEIDNCLKREYLKNIIEIIKPSYLLFFGATIMRIREYRSLLMSLLNVHNVDIIADIKPVPAYVSKKTMKKIQVTVGGCKIKDRDLRIIFWPHPSFHFKSDFEDDAINDVCEWFNRQQ
jgi:uracil-DNA glycosylase